MTVLQWWWRQGGGAMTKPLPVNPAPGPLEHYAQRFDDLFSRARAQREGFRRYLEGLLLPAERNKTLTALANTEPLAGAQRKEAQSLQWFLSESGWDSQEVNERRLELLMEDPATAPNGEGVLVIDEHGDRKWGKKTAHVGKQWLGNIGKTDNGVVSVSTLWADEGVYWPQDFEPYTPAHHFKGGNNDPRFRTKLKIARELVMQAVEEGIPFRAVVADSFYGEDEELRWTLRDLGAGYVLALKPSHGWGHREGEEIGALWEAALGGGWEGPDSPGEWTRVERRFSDGHIEEWWALEVRARPYGPGEPSEQSWLPPTPKSCPRGRHGICSPTCPILPAPSARQRAIRQRPSLRRWYACTGLGCGWNRISIKMSTCRRCLERRTVAQHCPKDVDPPPSERDQSLGMLLALTPFAVVEGSGFRGAA